MLLWPHIKADLQLGIDSQHLQHLSPRCCGIAVHPSTHTSIINLPFLQCKSAKSIPAVLVWICSTHTPDTDYFWQLATLHNHRFPVHVMIRFSLFFNGKKVHGALQESIRLSFYSKLFCMEWSGWGKHSISHLKLVMPWLVMQSPYRPAQLLLQWIFEGLNWICLTRGSRQPVTQRLFSFLL